LTPGTRIREPGCLKKSRPYFRELKTIFKLKILKFSDLFDPGSGIRDGKIQFRDLP
jgi:hypothetical protein